MGYYLQFLLDWSEVWALLLPVCILLIKRKQPAFLKPIIIYIWLALIINIIIDVIMVYKAYLPGWLQSNNPLYNIHSVVRFICFSLFFIKLRATSYVQLKKFLAVVFVIFFVINFIFFENFLNAASFSGNLLATESYLLLIYGMLYYLSELRHNSTALSDGADFWVVTGLCIYVVINFFVFLFYGPMLNVNEKLAENMWNVHNIAFIIFCIFITKSFYGIIRNKHTV